MSALQLPDPLAQQIQQMADRANLSVVDLLQQWADKAEPMDAEAPTEIEGDLLKRIMETSPSGINVVDRNGNIIYSNQRADEILGAPKDEITQRTYDDLGWKHTDYDGNPWRDDQQPFVRVMKTKQAVWDVRHAIEWSDGTIVYLSINGMPMLDEQGEVDKVVFTIEDHTEKKRQADELHAALARERDLNTMRSRFVSMVSHEFRTPLSIMMTSISILRLHLNNLPREKVNQRLHTIEAQIHRLDDLLNEVGLANKSSQFTKQVSYEKINVQTFFDSIAESAAQLTNDAVQVLARFIGDPAKCQTISSDSTLLYHIFMNLVGNAVKYTPDGGVVTLSYGCDDEQFIATVEDRGIGIPKDDQKQIFELFHRARNVGDIRGTGLGLGIAQACVNALGGTISFESTENVGTTFTVQLPIAQPDQRTQ